jgi:protein-tyrosine phosphatase
MIAPAAPRIGVLFVCHANICRSPLAHGIFVHQARLRGATERFDADSAGTWAQDGVLPHAMSVAVAREHGIDLPALVGKSRAIVPADLHRFDHVLAMDRLVLGDLERLRGLSAFGPVEPGKARLRLLREVVDPRAHGADADVADPVRSGADAFAATFALLSEACERLLDELLSR